MVKHSPQNLASEEGATTPTSTSTPTPTTHTPCCTDYLLSVQTACCTSCLLYILPNVHLIYCTYRRAKSSARIAYCADCLLYRFSIVEIACCSNYLLISVRLTVVLNAYCQLVGLSLSWCFKPSQPKQILSGLVSWCFEPSQPQRITSGLIISGLRKTFIQRYIVERTTKAEMRLEEQSEKAEGCWENVWTEIQLKGP